MKKQKDNKILINFFILILLSVGMFVAIYKKVNPKDLKIILLTMDKKYILLAIVFFILFRMMEAISLYKLLRNIGQKVKIKNCINYSMLGYFFSQITPSGGGGQPAQLYFMSLDGISVDKALSVIVPFNIMYHISLSICGILSLSTPLRHLILNSRLNIFFYLGLLIQILSALLVLLVIINTKVLTKILVIISKSIKKIPFLRKFYKDESYIKHYLEKIKINVITIINNKNNFIIIFILQILMLFFYYGVAYFSYRALGFNSYNIFDIVRIQCLITIATEYIPTPGTAGFAEITMYSVYKKILSKDLSLTWMMINRFLMMYMAVIITLIILYRRNLIIKNRRDGDRL
ncbi:uncharacterized protein (TIRG00374 family) [Peptoniphilus olsenii]|uniref:Phosphatidylglycerol lysyltransferase n=1 Tax=Peptoniphilus olsenii TaxID=411570 RepID=A0ABV2JDD1_9FIRM